MYVARFEKYIIRDIDIQRAIQFSLLTGWNFEWNPWQDIIWKISAYQCRKILFEYFFKQHYPLKNPFFFQIRGSCSFIKYFLET